MFTSQIPFINFHKVASINLLIDLFHKLNSLFFQNRLKRRNQMLMKLPKSILNFPSRTNLLPRVFMYFFILFEFHQDMPFMILNTFFTYFSLIPAQVTTTKLTDLGMGVISIFGIFVGFEPG